MQDDDLIRMANQIAAFFTPYSEDEAVAGIADHLAKFWEPRMRKQLLAIAPGAKGLDPLVARALEDPAVAAG
jgi:formate dehydrogenase subunit delta